MFLLCKDSIFCNIIPFFCSAPVIFIERSFSGYFLHPLRQFQKNLDIEEKTTAADKSIVRPTFSYMGDFSISDEVLIQLAIHESLKIKGIVKIRNINVRKTSHGVHMDITAVLRYGCSIPDVCREAQLEIRRVIEDLTSVNMRRIHFLIRELKK